MILYELPKRWLAFDRGRVADALVAAKAAVQTLKTLPYQRSWVEKLQEVQLKREVAGTSRIEGAVLTERELEAAIRPDVTAAQLLTRSQQQAHAAMVAYRWLATVPDDRSISVDLICEIHRLMVTGCDDDHCPPGILRGKDHNVTFGVPRHRGVAGGPECERAFASLISHLDQDGREVDPLMRALALHYHLAAMHPFLDGNGRTARAAEALTLQRAGLTDRAFISMSNYYYEEKAAYLDVLSETRAAGHDLTAFFLFGLRGIRLQCEVLTSEIRKHMQKALFENTMYKLFNRLETKRKRVIGERQVQILKVLLERDEITALDLYRETQHFYAAIKDGFSAYFRDLWQLLQIGAINTMWVSEDFANERVSINLDWPQEIDESEFMRKITSMPKGKSFKFLR